MSQDHYRTLGVSAEARSAEIRAAYLAIMRANHPDRRPGDPVAADVARRVNAAYHVVGDASRRSRYDGLREARSGAAQASRDQLLRSASQARRAYAAAKRRHRRAFTRACLRAGVAVLLLGIVLLAGVA